MIKDNKIIFGYGDVSVSDSRKQLVIRELKIPLKIGTKVIDYNKFSVLDDEAKNFILNNMEENPDLYKFVEFNRKIRNIVIRFSSISDIEEFISKLNDVIHLQNESFMFHGYEFDFTSRNIESVGVVFRHVRRIAKLYYCDIGYSIKENRIIITNSI